MFFRRPFSVASLASAIAVIALFGFAFAPEAVPAQTVTKPTIVLVHGAWADAYQLG